MKNVNTIFKLMMPLLFLFQSISFSQDVPDLPVKIEFNQSQQYFNSYRLQSNIMTDQGIGALAKDNSIVGKEAVSFGFAERSEDAKFVIIGSLYSEVLAYLRGGKTDYAVECLESMETEFIKLNVPSSLYNYISKISNMIERGLYSKEVLGEFLSLFQPFYEDYARGLSEDKLILFRAGSWLVDMSLVAAAGNRSLLSQVEKVEYFAKEMKRMEAPKGVLDNFEKIHKIVEKEKITDNDVKKLLKLVKKIQMILS